MRKYLKTLLFLLLPLLIKSQVTDGLVAKYTFNNGSTRDEVGGNDAKAVGASLVNDRFGNARSAWFLPGNHCSYLNLGTSRILKPASATISLWVYIHNINHKGTGVPFNPFIITKRHGGDDFFESYFMGIEINTRNVNANMATGEASGVGITSGDPLTIQEWHHLVLAYDDNCMWLYIDGVLQNNNKPMPKKFRTEFLETDSVVIGSMANLKNNRFLAGTVDDIMIYNRVLPQDEVYALYTAPNPDRNSVYRAWLYRIIALLVIIAGIVWLIIKRYKKALEAEKEKNRINMRLIELETKALRTQMNPHFMFNSLNTLQRYILEEDTKGAHVYLSKFSKLLRKILESSTSESISLKEELSILNTYVEIERLRFNNSFDYRITSTVADPETCDIPFLLVQPFVENAIWHGLLPLKGPQQLSISFSDAGAGTILCVVEDNGVGRQYSAARKGPLNKKSQALIFIKQRLEMLSKFTGAACAFTITDKQDGSGKSAGTKVEINIPKLNL